LVQQFTFHPLPLANYDVNLPWPCGELGPSHSPNTSHISK
jgi:hypothetical protein